jgi:hypothetical protein
MKILFRKTLAITIIISLVSFSSLINIIVSKVYAAGLLSSSSVQMSDSRPSQAGTSYLATFTPTGITSISCIKIVFAPNADMTGGNPTAMSIASSVKGTFTNLTTGNWTLDNTTPGTIKYTYATGEATSASPTSVQTTTITNTSTAIFYAQTTTYSDVSCSTAVDQSNVMALTTVAGVNATVTVSPTISFSVAYYGSAVNGSGDASPVTTTSTTIPFGTVAAGATAWGAHTLTVSTNGAHGYTLYTRYSAQMNDSPASDVIRDQSGTPTSGNAFDASASQSSLAYTTDAGGSYDFGGSNMWAGFTATNVAINAKTAAVNADATHIEYKIGISNTQPPGTYSTVIAYTATPSY